MKCGSAWHMRCQHATVASSTQTTNATASCILLLSLGNEFRGKVAESQRRGEIPREVDDVVGSPRGRVAEHVAEAVAPLELGGQVGLASHEVVA